MEALHDRQESIKKEGSIQKLESERRELSEKIDSLNSEIVELNNKIQKQSEGKIKVQLVLLLYRAETHKY